ncbi:translation elongation factor Ts [Geobacter sp. SVR]|uniref:translation elongation factor Ts n=1 Tax=Geobacter sp. SVR TaxID=2495594 RepID=UPI00143F00D6|nr:translation elongation factor Ts [Geobacter sp. SVR]BCS54686.1 elongation factor Ts [Geobacter sp. SVR]GCF87626.1 elongation factor Ts [Geobacter sp. SVR]
MAITATQINELRKSTGAGMLDCKKALEQNDGDFEKAVDFLRTKGLAAAAKKAGRAATEGVVAAFVSDDLKSGVLVEVNSETDFVAKNDKFQAFVADIGRHILATSPADCAAMLEQPFVGDTSKNVQAYLSESIAVIGENLQIRRFVKFDVQGSGLIGSYIHAGGKIGVLVQIDSPAVSDANRETLQAFVRDIAMHSAAAAPQYVSRDQVPADVLEREKEIYRVKAKESGKPDAIIEKILDGQINKFYAEICLNEQVFVKDTDKGIGQVVKEVGSAVGGPVSITRFERFVLGEGLEKKESDFAAEVAAAAGLQ